MNRELFETASMLYNSADASNPECVEYTEALSILDKIALEGGEIDDVYNLRWHIHYLRNNLDDALRDLNLALDINPESRNVLYNRGCLYHRMGELTEALADFKFAVLIAKREGYEDLVDAVEHHIVEIKEQLSKV